MHELLAAVSLLPPSTWTKIRNRRLGKGTLTVVDDKLVFVDTTGVHEVSDRRLRRLAEIVVQSIIDRDARR